MVVQSTYVLVEDNDFDRVQLKRIVLKEDPAANVVEFSNLTDVRNYLKDGKADYILLDNKLPDGVGSDYAKELANDERHSEVPIVMVSDDHLAEFGDVLARNGRTAMLPKDDLSPSALKKIVEKFLVEEVSKADAQDLEASRLILETFSKQIGEQMLTPLSRALRLTRSAKLTAGSSNPQRLIDTLSSLENTLIASRNYAHTLMGDHQKDENSHPIRKIEL